MLAHFHPAGHGLCRLAFIAGGNDGFAMAAKTFKSQLGALS
jgi:hypothetical protein